jgi:pimeloyl-ACP methyl ester carboxylesterase
MIDLLLLHGALGAADQLVPLAERLAGRARVHVVELEGHGRTPPRGRAFAMEHFAESVVEALDALGIARAEIFGYSMGGYVALHLAATRPERVTRVTTLGTKFRWDPELAEREAHRLDPATIRAKVPRFAEALEARHAGAGGWEAVLGSTAALLRSLGARPLLDDAVLGAIAQPVRVMVGDRDATVTVEESAGAYRALGNGELVVLPRTPHPLEQVDVGQLAAFV